MDKGKGMGNFSAEQKLELIHNIRMEHQSNRLRMKHREQILYGMEPKTIHMPDGISERFVPGDAEWESAGRMGYDRTDAGYAGLTTGESSGFRKRNGSFRLRMFVSVLLFGGYLLLDRGDLKAEFTSAQLVEIMNRDFSTGTEEMVFDFENSFPYTLFRKP